MIQRLGREAVELFQPVRRVPRVREERAGIRRASRVSRRDQRVAQADVALGVIEVAVRRAAQLVGRAVLVDQPRDLVRMADEVGRELRWRSARSIGRPLLSLRSSRRQAAACGRISSFGYHLKGTLTSSASIPARAQLRAPARARALRRRRGRTAPALRRRATVRTLRHAAFGTAARVLTSHAGS